jgi:hypothetical protein
VKREFREDGLLCTITVPLSKARDKDETGKR